MLELNKLTTESRNPDTVKLDTMTPLEIASVMNREDENVVTGIPGGASRGGHGHRVDEGGI